jgi:truncated hemoglobin YjbI
VNVSDIPKLHSTMVLFLTHIFGGPNHYEGPDMKKLHKRMPIVPQHFHITWEHMEAAFLISKLSKTLIAKLKEEVYKQFDDIVQIKD